MQWCCRPFSRSSRYVSRRGRCCALTVMQFRHLSGDDLWRESAATVSVALDVRESYRSFFSRSTHTAALERSLDRLSHYHSMDTQFSNFSGFSTSTLTKEDDAEASNMDDWLKENDPAKLYHPVFFLSKTERPPLPPDSEEGSSDPVVLNWYTTSGMELRKFARERKIPVGSKKIVTFLNILKSYNLPLDTVYIRDSDLSRNGVELSCHELNGLRDGIPSHTLYIRSPRAPVTDGCLPISTFIYVETPADAAGAADLLSDESFTWQLGAEKFDSRSVLNPVDNESEAEPPEVEAATGGLAQVAAASAVGFQQLHPQLPAVQVFPGLALRAKSREELVGVDTETTGLDPHTSQLRLLSLSWTGFPTLIIDVFKLFCRNGTVKEALIKDQVSPSAQRLLQALTDLLSCSPVTKVFFNGKFDYKFIFKYLGIKPAQPLRDAMLSTALIEAGQLPVYRNYSLNSVVMKEFNFPLPLPRTVPWVLDEGWKRDTLPNDQLVYASRDAAILPYLMAKISKEIQEASLKDVEELESQCFPAVAEMELRGVVLDSELWSALADRLAADVLRCEQELREALGWVGEEGHVRNINSPKQLLEAFQKIYESSDHTASEGFPRVLRSTSVSSLTSLESANHEVAALLRYRKSQKLKSACLSQCLHTLNPVTGRIHASFNQLGAASGRFSCENPNLQQIPRMKAFRQCFRAADGYAFVVADFSQIELRIAADVASDQRMIQAFARNEDLHRVTASLLKGVPPSAATKSDRQLAKAVNFGLIYGISPKGLKQYARQSYDVNLTLEEATAFRKAFFQHYTGLADWHKSVTLGTENANGTYIVTRTRSNRRALFSQTNIRFQQLLNYPVQGTSADIVKETLIQLYKHPTLQFMDAHVLLCVHDEVVLEVPIHHAEEALSIVVHTMEAAGNKYLKHVRCVAEGAIGPDWSYKP